REMCSGILRSLCLLGWSLVLTLLCILRANRSLGDGQKPKSAAFARAEFWERGIWRKRWRRHRAVRRFCFALRRLGITEAAEMKYCGRRVAPAMTFCQKSVASGKEQQSPRLMREFALCTLASD